MCWPAATRGIRENAGQQHDLARRRVEVRMQSGAAGGCSLGITELHLALLHCRFAPLLMFRGGTTANIGRVSETSYTEMLSPRGKEEHSIPRSLRTRADKGGLAPPSSSLLRTSTQAGPQGIPSPIGNAFLFSAGCTKQPLTQDEKKETGREGGRRKRNKNL